MFSGVLAEKMLPLTVSVPALTLKMPPPDAAELPENVQPLIVTVAKGTLTAPESAL
jgi:hypothetical protein